MRKEKQMKRTFIILFAMALALGLCLVAAMPVAADPGTTYYVSTTGSDVTGDGSYSNPWATIQHAVDNVSSGDTIMVAPGTYTGAILDKGVTVSGLGPGDSIIDTGVPYKAGSGLTTAFRLDAGADGAEVSDFTINCDGGTGFYFAIFARVVDDVTIDNLEINDTVQGISNWGGGDWEITSNTITDTVAAGGGGIGIFLGAMDAPSGYGTCCDNLVQYNTIDASASAVDYSCPAICIALDLRSDRHLAVNGSEDISGNQILGNTITASAANNLVGIEVGTILGNSETDPDRDDPVLIAAVMAAAAVHDNTVQDNSVDGADIGIFFYNATNLTITQNTVQNNVGYGMYAEHGQSGTVITDNSFTNNDVQLVDDTDDTDTLDSLDIAAILSSNTFDRAVTVDHPGASLLHTIWSSIQDGVDASVSGDTVSVGAGTYDGTINVEDFVGLNISGVDKTQVTIKPSTTLDWNVASYGSSRQTVFRIVDSTDVVLENMTMDFDLVKGNLIHGILYWDSTGTVDNNVLQNMSVADASGGYYEITSYYRADNYSPESRADITISNNTFIDPGRLGACIHTYVDATITDNTFYKTTDDFGYAMELGSEATGSIVGNTIYGYDTAAASDGSNSAGIYVENSFTWSQVSPLTKTVSVTDNEVYDCQWGLHVGNEFNGYSGDVDIVLELSGNNFHDNTDGGVVISDEDKESGSSVSVSGGGNNLLDNTDYGYYIYTQGDGDITIDLTGETITGQGTGVYVQDTAGESSTSSYSVSVQSSNISGNPTCGVNNTVSSFDVDATANWWGDASGPYNGTTNPSGTGNSVSDNVDYTPWWGASYIGVSHPWGWYTNDSIQDAIDAASAGDTINVMAGTYVEDLVIPAGKDSLDLKGSGCNVTTIKGVSTASVGPPVYNIRFDEFDGVDGVKIHGFTIESPDVPTDHFASGMVLNGQDIEIYDNCFVSKGAEGAEDNYCVAIQSWRWSAAPDSDLTGLQIYDNTFSSEGDLWVYQGVFVNRDGEDFGDITVSGNDFTGNIHMGIAYEGNNALISDNEMTSTYEGVGIAIMDWAELEQDGVDVDGNELQGFDYGVLIGRGAQVMTNITVANNVFSDNNYQVRDRVDTLNMEDVLADNTFDRAVVVRGSGIKVPTIFSSIPDAIDAAVAGDTVDVATGTYTHTAQILLDKDLTITGEDKETTVIEPASGFTDSYLFRINDGEVNLSNLTFDGKNSLYGGVRYTTPGTGTLNNNIFKDIVYSTYLGFGVVAYADNVTASNNAFTNIGRVGIWVGGDNAVLEGNTYTGKGAIDCLDYGIEVGMGGVATITDNTITNCLGVASSDGSTSAAILVTTYYGTGTEATITGNTLTGNTGGIAVGYDSSDTSTVVAHYNNISGNTDYGIDTTAPSVDATANWWGATSGPYHDELNPDGEGDSVSDNVLFEPWYADEGMTTLTGHSTYEFIYDVPDVVVALEETEIPVTFQTDELGAVGYYGVRFKFNATGPGNVIFKATDSEEVEHTFVNSGFWGPSAGFNITADYSDTTDWSMNFSEPGEYNITFSLIEAPDGDVIASIEDSEDITVRAVDIFDHYRHLHEPFDEVTTLDLLAAADDWIANEAPPGFDDPITTMQLLALADEWFSS
jgi:parallel beta-helix repeat protein